MPNQMQIKLTWTPSQDALDQGIVPEDWSQYDVDTDSFEGDALNLVVDSITYAAGLKFAHAMNNESAAAWISAKKRDKDPLADTVENRTKFLHDWRVNWRDNFIAGKLGTRRGASAIPVDERTKLMQARALVVMAGFVTANGGTFTYTEVNKRTLDAMYGDTGMTIKQVMDSLLDPEQSPTTAAEIAAYADEELAKRAAAKTDAASNTELAAFLTKMKQTPVQPAAK